MRPFSTVPRCWPLLWNEPGADYVAAALPGALLSSVNLAEVVTKLCERGSSASEGRELVESLASSSISTRTKRRRPRRCEPLHAVSDFPWRSGLSRAGAAAELPGVDYGCGLVESARIRSAVYPIAVNKGCADPLRVGLARFPPLARVPRF